MLCKRQQHSQKLFSPVHKGVGVSIPLLLLFQRSNTSTIGALCVQSSLYCGQEGVKVTAGMPGIRNKERIVYALDR